MAGNSTEINVRGKWTKVPTLELNGKNLIVTGRWLKVASIHDEDWLEVGVADPESYINRLRDEARSLPADVFTFAQRLPDSTPRYQYPIEWDNVAAIRLTNGRDCWEKNLPQETRKNIRRSAKRGVVTRVTELNNELIYGIEGINNESPIRQGRQFYHYRKDGHVVRRDYSTFLDRSEFIGAYHGDELIGLIRLVHMGQVTAVLEFLSKSSHYDKRPTNALIAKAVDQCLGRGTAYLIYGKYRYGNNRRSALTEFKRRNGFEEFPIPRYFVPLTVRGKICVACKLYRDLAGIIPGPLIYPLLSLRRLWYQRRLTQAGVAQG